METEWLHTNNGLLTPIISYGKFLVVFKYFPEINSRLNVPNILKIIIVDKGILCRFRIAGNICFECSYFVPVPQWFIKPHF